MTFLKIGNKLKKRKKKKKEKKKRKKYNVLAN